MSDSRRLGKLLHEIEVTAIEELSERFDLTATEHARVTREIRHAAEEAAQEELADLGYDV